MAALPDLALVLALVALTAAQVSPPEPQALMKPSPPVGIASAVGDCWGAVGANGVDRAKLAVAGWTPVLTDAADKGASPLEPYAKAGEEPLIMLVKDRSEALCTVIARVGSREDARTTVGEIDKKLKASDSAIKPMRDGEGVAFLSSPRAALVDLMTGASGTADQPGLRIVVGYKDSEKK